MFVCVRKTTSIVFPYKVPFAMLDWKAGPDFAVIKRKVSGESDSED